MLNSCWELAALLTGGKRPFNTPVALKEKSPLMWMETTFVSCFTDVLPIHVSMKADAYSRGMTSFVYVKTPVIKGKCVTCVSLEPAKLGPVSEDKAVLSDMS